MAKKTKTFWKYHNPDNMDVHTAKLINDLDAENAKLNVILYHRENGLSHPDLQGEINKSVLAHENSRMKIILIMIQFHGFSNGLGLTCAEMAENVLEGLNHD